MDGTAILNMYELKEMPLSQDASMFITREEFNEAIAKITQTMGAQIAEITASQVPPQAPAAITF